MVELLEGFDSIPTSVGCEGFGRFHDLALLADAVVDEPEQEYVEQYDDDDGKFRQRFLFGSLRADLGIEEPVLEKEKLDAETLEKYFHGGGGYLFIIRFVVKMQRSIGPLPHLHIDNVNFPHIYSESNLDPQNADSGVRNVFFQIMGNVIDFRQKVISSRNTESTAVSGLIPVTPAKVFRLVRPAKYRIHTERIRPHLDA